MPSFRHLMVAVLMACAAPAAFAQQALEQQMTAGEFRAAGLDKLSAEELANLNRWLQGQVQETTVAVEQAREEGRQQARQQAEAEAVGRRAGSTPDGPINSSIVGEFNGFGRGLRYTLENGQVWEQTDATRLEGVQMSNPGVTINSGVFGTWYLRVDGYNARAKVRRVD